MWVAVAVYQPSIHHFHTIWGFPGSLGDPQNAWFTVENPMKIGDLGVPPFSENSI